MNRLAGIFEIKFNFHVTEAELGSRNTQFQLEGRISQWLAENNCKDNLLIVYYAGHGTYMNEKKELKISPYVSANRAKDTTSAY